MKTELKVGDKLYIGRYDSYGTTYTLAEVVKVTPKGFVDVRWVHGTVASKPIRFNPDGEEFGVAYYNKLHFDDKTVEERNALLAQDRKERAATQAVKVLIGEQGQTYRLDRESATKKLDEVQAQIDAAREYVNDAWPVASKEAGC